MFQIQRKKDRVNNVTPDSININYCGDCGPDFNVD